MIENFLRWVAEKFGSIVFVCVSVSLCVCSSILAPGARTAGPIGTGEELFDATEQRKDDGANHGAISGTCQRANPCKKYVDRDAGLTNGRIRLKLCGLIATMGGQNPFEKAMVLSSYLSVTRTT